MSLVLFLYKIKYAVLVFLHLSMWLSTMISSSIHFPTNDENSFFFMGSEYPVGFSYVLCIGGYLGCCGECFGKHGYTDNFFLHHNATSNILGVDSQITWYSCFECFEEPPYSFTE